MPPRFTTLAEWLVWLETLHPKKIDMTLDRVLIVLETLGLRPPPFTVITVGGTNGKGSCVAILESLYRQGGYRVGAFTSPHLWRFNERIRVNGEEASDRQLMLLFEEIEASLGATTLSYFESSTVAALLHFAHEAVDVAVLEVGMGGRLDAVNGVDADAALIVSVDIDHQEFLGGDRETIGREKAGILRGGRPAIVGERQPPATVTGQAQEIGADLRIIGRDFDFRRRASGGAWAFEAPGIDYRDLPAVPFGGEVQYANAAACIALVEGLRDRLPLDGAALRAGLLGARLSGRAEGHLRDGVEWVFDVGHNPAAAKVFRGIIEALPPAGSTLAVFAAMHDKDLEGVLRQFVPIVQQWFLTQADLERGAPVAALLDVLAGFGIERAVACPDVAAACAAAAAAAASGDRVLVFGSFHAVGPALSALGLYSTPSERGD